jgi:uncharacterized integral membrane protein (TIGR00697 family)
MSDQASFGARSGPSRPEYLQCVTAVFVTALITANILAVKPIQLGPLLFPAGVIVFPISYIFGDVLTEVYGYARARQVIWIGFGCNLLAVVAIAIAGRLPAAPFWSAQTTAYASILGVAPRVLAASFTAYLVGEFLNSFVLAKMKVATSGRWLWTRTIGSTLVGQLADSAMFITLAFAGVWPGAELAAAIGTQWLLKSGYETLATPWTYLVVGVLKRAEGLDVFDVGTDYNPFRFRWRSARKDGG